MYGLDGWMDSVSNLCPIGLQEDATAVEVAAVIRNMALTILLMTGTYACVWRAAESAHTMLDFDLAALCL